MRKIALIGATFLTAVSLAGCGGDDEGLRNNTGNNLGVEPTRYNETMDIAPNRDRLEIDEDEFGPDYYNDQGLNDRYNTRNINENENNGNFHGNDVNRNDTMNNNEDRNNNHDTFEVARRAADRLTDEIEEVERAYVFTGPENAYVAVVLNNNQSNGEIPEELKNRIQRTVKAVDEDIDDVFVSTNPDFVKQAGDYTDQLEAGDPVEGLFEEMGDVFERVFPNQ